MTLAMTQSPPKRCRNALLLGLSALLASVTSPGCEKGADPEADLRDATVYIQVEGALREPGSSATTQKWSGSGVLVTQDGYIVTNNHVAGGSTIRSVTVNGETTTRPATLLGISECSDLAVIKIQGEGLPFLSWHEGSIEPGLEVMSAGFPGITGQGVYTLTKGAVNTNPAPLSTAWASVQQAIYHTAQINTGNSGGPLVSAADASLVGINYAGRASENANIAIAASEARTIVEQLKLGNDVNSIGISGDVRFTEQNGLKIPAGVWVTAVRPGGKADTLGIRPGDLITKIGGIDLQIPTEQKNHSLENYCSVLRSNDPNTQTIPVEIFRPDAGISCEGQINGSKLSAQATNGQQTDCPVGPGGQGGADGGGQGGGDQGGGDQGGGDQGGGEVPQINEIEPNQDATQAQTLSAPVVVSGRAKQGDAAIGTQDDPTVGEDLYVFHMATPGTAVFMVEGLNQSDFDVYVINMQSQIIGQQTTRGPGRETLTLQLQAGQYAIVVDAWSSVTTEQQYALGFALSE